MESDSSTSEGSETETGSSLPVSESAVSDETESAADSETVADEQTVPVTVSEEYAILLATNQADSMMGHAGVPFPVSWTVKMKKKQKETQDILSYHTQAAGCSDKARAKASGGRQPIEECGRTGL